jgi:hypothetical protein
MTRAWRLRPNDCAHLPSLCLSRAIQEKEKLRQISCFWFDVDEHFSFPSSSQLPMVRPRLPTDFYDSYHGPGSSTSFGKTANTADPAFRIPPAGEHWRDVAERAREEELARLAPKVEEPVADNPADAKKKKALAAAAAAKKKGKKSLSTALLTMGLDDAKSKKALLDTDKLLGGDKTFHVSNGQTLSMRLLSMLIEAPPSAPKSGPWFPHPSGKDKKPERASATTHKKKAAEYTLDKRIEMELKYLGLLGGTPEYSVSGRSMR